MRYRFFTLGRFELSLDGQPVSRPAWGTHRAATLAKVLLTHCGAALHRDHIGELIWPDRAPGMAARNLRVALTELRNVLEPERLPRHDGRFITATYDTLRLEVEHLWVDAQVLLDAADVDPATASAVATLERAAALYRGDYLPDDLYADWASIERERLRRAHETILAKLTLAHVCRGDLSRAVDVCRLGLLTYPTSERLMDRRLLIAEDSNTVAEALLDYQRFVRALNTELGVNPPRHLSLQAEHLTAASSTSNARPAVNGDARRTRNGVPPPTRAARPSPVGEHDAFGPAPFSPNTVRNALVQLRAALAHSASLRAETRELIERTEAALLEYQAGARLSSRKPSSAEPNKKSQSSP